MGIARGIVTIRAKAPTTACYHMGDADSQRMTSNLATNENSDPVAPGREDTRILEPAQAGFAEAAFGAQPLGAGLPASPPHSPNMAMRRAHPSGSLARLKKQAV